MSTFGADGFAGFAPKFRSAPELQSLHQNYDWLLESCLGSAT
jgi:hypothetical protein